MIEDFRQDLFYADSPLGRAGTRFYAGAPLVTSDGYGLGALCVLGGEPRKATDAEMTALVDLAAMVMAQIELQHAFGRIDPVSGLPTRSQFRDDLIDLSSDSPGERRFAVVVDLAREDQIGLVLRALGSARVDDLVRESSLALQAALDIGQASAPGPGRDVVPAPGRDVLPAPGRGSGDRGGHLAYHVGATQFAFLSPAGVEQDAYVAALKTAYDAVRASSSSRFVTTVAIGVRPFVLGEASADDVLRGAASAAQDARRTDGAIALYSPANDTAHVRRYGLLRDFGAALEADDQLRLVYQPRIDLATGRCNGAEALLRWRHPRLGDVSPGEFIPIIEQTALARPTTQWVLDAALDQLAAWTRSGLDLTLSVNISAANLGELDLIQRVQMGLMRRLIMPRLLEIELTESAIMDQPDQALGMLRELSAAGVGLAIDDFGTGHSSLAYLQRMPVDVVKIDQAFVRPITAAAGPDHVLLETMIGLAHRLGYRVVAEGVETLEAAAVLTGLHCEEAQGYWFARPLEPDAFLAWLSERDVSGVGAADAA